MRRREFLGALGAGAAGFGLTPEAEIEERVRKARPLSGGPIPRDLAERLGATHYGGRYFLSDKPYLLEGCAALRKLGMGVAKFWCGRSLGGYDYNSEWGFTAQTRLVDVVRHRYFVDAFAHPFSTFALEIAPVGRDKRFPDPDSYYAEDEAEMYELAAHLFRTYRERKVTFILQHWEGDWMLRGRPGEVWKKGGPPDAEARCEGFVRWLAARQRAVERARTEAGGTKCRVYHAAEVNKVWDGVAGIPTLTTHVLPKVAVDLVSWSSYDGMGSAVRAWQGIELIRRHARPSPAFGKLAVFIGEVGKPEQGQTERSIVEWWDRAMGVFIAQKMPWIIHWELYCNEPKDGNKRLRTVLPADRLRGFWLIRPDGSLSWSAKYLSRLLAHAGGRLGRKERVLPARREAGQPLPMLPRAAHPDGPRRPAG
jgi:hypothetical protein